jgi:hypothetical protein
MKSKSITFFNLWVLLLAIFGLNHETNPYMAQQLNYELLAEDIIVEYNHLASEDEIYAERLDDLGITLHPEAGKNSEGKSSPRSLNHCKSLIYRTLKSLPEEQVKQLKSLTLRFTEDGRRGLGGGSTIILRCVDVTDEELVGVLVHEMGHITDTGLIDGLRSSGESGYMDGGIPVYNDDISLEFYNISWEDDETMKEDMSALDFVSGYAMTDPFEDFAESYAYYVLHGDEFRSLAQFNPSIRSKYNYLKTRAFDGKEYEGGIAEGLNLFERHFDVTVLSYKLDDFFVI